MSAQKRDSTHNGGSLTPEPGHSCLSLDKAIKSARKPIGTNRIRRRSDYGYTRVMSAALIAVLACLAGILFARYNSPPAAPDLDTVQAQLGNALVLPEDFKQVPNFSLVDKNGQDIDQSVLQGQWNLLFFGFTQCPDVCPMTLSTAAKAVEQLQETEQSAAVPNVIFVSVDPQRDTPEVLKNYVEYFNTEFNAFTGTVNQMYELLTPLNIVVNFTANEDDANDYTVDHTASILLIDPQLRLRAKFNPPHNAADIATDYQTIVKHLGPVNTNLIGAVAPENVPIQAREARFGPAK